MYSRAWQKCSVANLDNTLVTYSLTAGGITSSRKTRQMQLDVHAQALAKLFRIQGTSYDTDNCEAYCEAITGDIRDVESHNLLVALERYKEALENTSSNISPEVITSDNLIDILIEVEKLISQCK